MSEPTRNYDATADVPANRFCKPGASDGTTVPAAASTDFIFGVSTGIDVSAGEPCDVQHDGRADLKLGGNVTRGQLLTSDSEGRGVPAAPAAGVNARHGALALESGVENDIIPVLLGMGEVQGAA
ncbi:MAG: DUF2190 family protein [Acidobacteria bacterium]|nr:DUF2190 family protein [Acidobacteriota bacterium]